MKTGEPILWVVVVAYVFGYTVFSIYIFDLKRAGLLTFTSEIAQSNFFRKITTFTTDKTMINFQLAIINGAG